MLLTHKSVVAHQERLLVEASHECPQGMQLTELLLSLITQAGSQKLVLVTCHCLGLQNCGRKCLLFNLSIILRGISLQIFHPSLLEFLHSDNQSLVDCNDQTLKYCLLLFGELLLEFFICNKIFILELFL